MAPPRSRSRRTGTPTLGQFGMFKGHLRDQKWPHFPQMLAYYAALHFNQGPSFATDYVKNNQGRILRTITENLQEMMTKELSTMSPTDSAEVSAQRRRALAFIPEVAIAGPRATNPIQTREPGMADTLQKLLEKPEVLLNSDTCIYLYSERNEASLTAVARMMSKLVEDSDRTDRAYCMMFSAYVDAHRQRHEAKVDTFAQHIRTKECLGVFYLGSEYIAKENQEYVRSLLEVLLNTRRLRNKPTILAGSLPPQDLNQRYGFDFSARVLPIGLHDPSAEDQLKQLQKRLGIGPRTSKPKPKSKPEPTKEDA